ncbi:MAG: type IX secretion system membrane protein PorP/SprF [Bacteroidales bacterium]|nr:type IX secretion system membrane protein PorP/SprF [Bacteroidales bacterium]
MKTRYMRSIKSILALIVMGMAVSTSHAQQVPMYSQYIMNGYLINPSVAGRDGYSTVTLTTREQWIGLEMPPATYAASFQTRILRNSYISKSTAVKKKVVKPTKGGNVGVGGYIFSDHNGIMRRTGFQMMYAYHIPMRQIAGYPSTLSFGLAFTGYQFAINTEDLIFDPDDPFLNNYDRSVFIPDFNFGATFTTARYYAGFSMTNLLRGALMFADTTAINRNELGHFFLTGGYKFDIAPDWVLEPSAFIKSSDLFTRTFQADITARVYYRNDYWLGISYRTNDAVILLVGVKYDRFHFGYATDFAVTDIRRQSLGTHELTLAIKFGESARRYRWINAF